MKKISILLLIFLPFLATSQIKGVKHFILIGLDGTGANYLSQAENIPHIKHLMKEGSYSYHARCCRPSSSAINWAAMTMGASPSLTGYTHWDSKTPEIPSRVTDKYGMFPSIFALMREQKPQSELGVIYTWGGIGYLFPKKAVNKDDHAGTDSATVLHAVNYIKSAKPNLLWIHFDGDDAAGHSKGYGSKAYYKSIQEEDTRIGQVVQAVKDAGMMKSTVILVTADHGGIKKGHGGTSMKEMEIPWILYGQGVKKDHVITNSIMTFDTASTIAYIFGLNQPQVWIGRPVTAAFK